ncbi:unnamed protein product [Closterium sp. NIES-64]|nr:unnamed protein product [Closterium sp. NIES-64]
MSVRQVEVTQVTEEVDRVVSLIEHRYIDYDGGFGAGLSPILSPFMARVKKGDNMVKVDGVDASGIPVKHTFELSELADKKHKFGGTLADCVKLGKAFAHVVDIWRKQKKRRPTKSPAPFQPANDKGGPEASWDDEREDDVAYNE